ncbi:MAG: nucleoside triphosphate pyrophosphatase [Pseudomonadota bacterium]|nr:nucleoside triphosphate pyrophosphatase [Pseudomonadota bacterium]
MNAAFYLASQSPRRHELLAQAGLRFAPLSVSVDETPRAREAGLDYVRRVVDEKLAAALAAAPTELPVLVADTEVIFDGKALGKPRDAAHAEKMLEQLSGETHSVVTRVVVGLGTRRDHVETTTHINFAPLTFAQIQRYCASGEPMGKAGAYAIQGQAAGFVLSLSGSLTGVIGLPVAETLELLSRFDVRPGGA